MDEVFIVAVVFGSLLILAKMLLDYARFRREHKNGSSASSSLLSESQTLRTSELEDMLRRIVREEITGEVMPRESVRRLEGKSTKALRSAVDEDDLLESDEPPITTRRG